MNQNSYITTLIVGIGNVHRKDDGLGVVVAEKLQHLVDNPTVSIVNLAINIFNLESYLTSNVHLDHLVIIDAITSSNFDPGTIIICNLDKFSENYFQLSTSTHNINIVDWLLMFKKVNPHRVPYNITLFGIIASDISLGDKFTTSIENNIKNAIDILIEWINTKKFPYYTC